MNTHLQHAIYNGQAIAKGRLEEIRAQGQQREPEGNERILDLLQAIAINHCATILTLDELLDKLAPDLPGLARDDIRRHCFMSVTARELHARRHVAMWRGADGRMRLVDGSVPISSAEAREFLAASAKVSGRICAFCLLNDEGFELRGLGPHQWIHAPCHPFYLRWHRAAVHRKPGVSPWEVLGLPGPNASRGEVQRAYKRAAQVAHPDKGGSTEAMAALNTARDEQLNHPAARTS